MCWWRPGLWRYGYAVGGGELVELVGGVDAGALVAGGDAVLGQDGSDVAGGEAEGGFVDAEECAEQPVADAGPVVAGGGGHEGGVGEPFGAAAAVFAAGVAAG